MAADRLPDVVREFAHYLDGLLARLDPSGGWCAVFWQRDPEGMRACLDGREMPPWDVVEALLQDLAGQYGPGGAGPETERARSLHAAALAAYDAGPGGRDALRDRLDVMLREQKYAAERQADLIRLLATAATREEADALRLDFAWAHDDHERATARCAELRARMADLDRRERDVPHSAWGSGDGRDAGVPGAAAGVSGGAGAAKDAAPGGRRGPRGGSSDDDGTWSGAWRRPNGGGFAAADGDARPGPGTGASPGAAADGGRPAGGRAYTDDWPVSGGGREHADAGPAFGGGRGYEGGGPASDSTRGHEGGGPVSDRGRMRSAPGGPYDPGAPATPGHREEPPSAVTGSAGRHDPRHADTSAETERRADDQGRAYQAGGTTSREETSGGFAAPGGRADARGGEYAAGRAASGEAGAGGASGGFATAPGGRAEAQDRAYPAGGAVSRPAAVGHAADALQGGPGHTDRTSWEAATGNSPAAPPPVGSEPTAPQPVTPKQRKRRRGGARFAGMVEEDAAPVAVPPAAVPPLPEPAPVTGRRKPRGARFAGAAEEVREERTEPRVAADGGAERRDVVQAVEALARLRKEGRSGEAHALLVEAATWAPARFPLLAHELERAGLGADWQTLLWEAASLPAGRLVAAADALGAAGRAADGRQILRQGVARPPGEIGQAVLGLVAEGRHREVRALLDAYVRARTPEEAARSAEPGPQTLVPLLLEAAQGVSDERRWDLLHALRVAGFPA
ncbi:hypothetical protein [Streptomyces coeruleorubidus]|uniref:UL36 very large tegument protein n=1 Tax=Streptomyces coeruleorubidus TaxID=116188 RepID=A0A5J6IB49_STRC4|nr:hypothetical protein [Streptomyces coeruleorubidus]QEV28832.1 hypothetical protein CP976_35075 [Streptomyces coeruleorubidus]GGT56307.1 hypothetical protein GCM10010256_11230 [Streptomyces coeruleorubidus]